MPAIWPASTRRKEAEVAIDARHGPAIVATWALLALALLSVLVLNAVAAPSSDSPPPQAVITTGQLPLATWLAQPDPYPDLYASWASPRR